MTAAAPLQQAKEEAGQMKSCQSSQDGRTGLEGNEFIDARSQAVAQRRMQEIADNSPKARQLQAFHAMTRTSAKAMQLKATSAMLNASVLQNAEISKKANKTGLPDNLKTGVESLSGVSMDDVKVHYNSARPAQLNAYAFAQGSDIHVGPGQQKHLPHEAWHVAQQKQGRVRATTQMKQGVPLNDDKSLEHEADVMGAKALQTKGAQQSFDQGQRRGTDKNGPAAGQEHASLLSTNAGKASSAVQRQERPAVVVWAVTHLVMNQGGSLFGDHWQSGELDADEGQLTQGQKISIDDEDVYMSRRGANQENLDRRQEDREGLKQHKWLGVTSVGSRGMDRGVYIRAETIRIERTGSKAGSTEKEGTSPELFGGLPAIHAAWNVAKGRRRRSIGLKVNDNIEDYNERAAFDDKKVSSGWNWDQFDEGVDVSSEESMQNPASRAPDPPSQKQWTLMASYPESPESIIAYMILEERKDNDEDEEEQPHLYLRWLIAHPNKGGGGSALMTAAKTILEKGNYEKIRVDSAYSAVPWYESVGFEVVTPGVIIPGIGYGDTELSFKNKYKQ